MTIVIGYVPTPVGEAALEAGLAEAAAHGDDVVILNSPRRRSTVDGDLIDETAAADLVARARRGGRDRDRRPGRARRRLVGHVQDGRRAHVRAAGRHRRTSSLARRQAGHGQRRPAAPARARRARPGRQARPMTPSRISRVVVTPVAFADPPLLNVVGVHQPWALRAIVEVHTDAGLLGLGETYADEAHLARLAGGRRRAAAATTRTTSMACAASSPGARGRRPAVPVPASAGCSTWTPRSTPSTRPSRSPASTSRADEAGVPVSDAARRRRPRPGAVQRLPLLQVGRPPRPARRRLGRGARPPTSSWPRRTGWSTAGASGRSSSRAGCCRPTQECEAIEALRDAFPDLPLRLDPNGAWTRRHVASRSPTGCPVSWSTSRTRPRASPAWRRSPRAPTCRSRPTCASSRSSTSPPSDRVRRRAGRAVRPPPVGRADDAPRLLAGITETWGLGLSMHSNSHLGVSLAAMTHLAAATPNLTYACDTHYPWKTQDVIAPGVLDFAGGSVAVPTGPGLGVELDRDALGAAARAVPHLRRTSSRGHRLHAVDRAGVHAEHHALVSGHDCPPEHADRARMSA